MGIKVFVSTKKNKVCNALKVIRFSYCFLKVKKQFKQQSLFE